jgi:hypothetical protein
MYRFIRTGQAKNDKLVEAIALGQKIVEHINANYPGTTFQLFTEIFGDVNRIHWISDYETLADIEAVMLRINQDQAYFKIVGDSPGVFIEGSLHDTMMSSL